MNAGDRIDRYIVERVLGQGGMSVVYLARHRRLRSMHAIKVLQINGPVIRKRLLLEGRVQASLKHPNVVAVTDVIEQGTNLALVMEYVNGPTLYDLVHEPMSVAEALGIFRGIASGIGAAHEAGLVHRDLKPTNIIMARTNLGMVPKVSDFGLVKVIEEGNTRTGVMMGTPNYMSPEQITDASTVDHRADLWALGVMLYEMLTGTSPFAAETHLATFNKVANRELRPVQELRPDLPPNIIDAIDGMLTVDPDERIQTANEVLSRLFVDGELLIGPDQADDFRDTLFTPLSAPIRGPEEPVVPVDATRLLGDETPAPEPRSRPVRARPSLLKRYGMLLWVTPIVVTTTVFIIVIGLFAAQFGARTPPNAVAPASATEPGRDLTLNIVGIEDGIDVIVVSSGQRVARQGPGAVRLAGMRVGGVNVGWAAGKGCDSDACPAQCQTWCTTGDTTIDIPAGEEPLTRGLIASSAPPRSLIIRGSQPIERARLGDVVGVTDGSSVVFDSVHPGRHLLFIDVGECPDTALDCSNDPGLECPDGCASIGQVITVSASTQPMDVEVELPSPAGAETPSTRTPSIVSGDAYARWLERHPEWQRDTAIADNRVNRRYLRNWTPSPPGGAVTLVSWEAASAYCSGRGGVRSIDAVPTTWVGAPDQEWRSADGLPAALTSNGDVKADEPTGRAIGDRGFRCAR